MTIEEIDKRDKRKAAVHEAGHLVVGLANGAQTHALIWREHVADPLQDKLWQGRAGYKWGLSADVRPISGVAGAVAELMDSGPIDPSDVAFLIETGEYMSESDKQSLGEADLWDAVNAAVAILEEHADFHAWVVAELLEHESISDGNAYDRFHGIVWPEPVEQPM